MGGVGNRTVELLLRAAAKFRCARLELGVSVLVDEVPQKPVMNRKATPRIYQRWHHPQHHVHSQLDRGIQERRRHSYGHAIERGSHLVCPDVR